MNERRPYEFPVGWINVTNGESEPVPPYGVCEITSIDEATGIAVVGKPSRDGQTNVFFNSGAPISPGKAGQVQRAFPTIAAYAADDGTGEAPAHDDIWGAAEDSFYLSPAQTGFRVIGEGGDGLCNVMEEPASATFTPLLITVSHWFETSSVVGGTSYEGHWSGSTPMGHVNVQQIRRAFSDTGSTKGPTGGVKASFIFKVVATGGTYKLKVNSTQTSALNYNDNAATVKSALDSASSPSTWTVTGDYANGFTCTADDYVNWTISSAYTDYSTLTPASSTIPLRDPCGLFSRSGDSLTTYAANDVLGQDVIAIPVSGTYMAIGRPAIPITVKRVDDLYPSPPLQSPSGEFVGGRVAFYPYTGLQCHVDETTGEITLFTTIATASCRGVVPPVPDEVSTYTLQSVAGVLTWV